MPRPSRFMHQSGEPILHLRQTKLMAHQVHEIGRILAIMDRERRIDPDVWCTLPQQACADRMEGASPCERLRRYVGIPS